MKILVAYDGSRSADSALDDLQRAGLPAENVEVLVVTVAEVWMPPQLANNGANGTKESQEITDRRFKSAESSVHEAGTLSRHAKKRILAKFPNWNIETISTLGSPAREILERADEFKPDLIVVGSQGRNAVGRILLGSISSKVLTQAKCSVRVARGKVEVDPTPVRILIGFDGSNGSNAAVEQVVSRDWKENTEVRLIAAVHSLVPTAIGRFIPPVNTWIREEFDSEKQWMKGVAEESLRKLGNRKIDVELMIREGHPKDVLVTEAAQWRADSIFLGAHSYTGQLDRFLIGSTSAAVAERANCSVEAVRSKMS